MAEFNASRTVISWGLPSVEALRELEGMKAVRAAGLVVRREELATGEAFSSNREGCLAVAAEENDRRPDRLALTRAKEAKAERAAAMSGCNRGNGDDGGSVGWR